jgi:hypothetical protein
MAAPAAEQATVHTRVPALEKMLAPATEFVTASAADTAPLAVLPPAPASRLFC